MDSVERIGCCELMCLGLSKILRNDDILIPSSSPEMLLRCSPVEQFVNDTDCDELLGCVDRSSLVMRR